MDNEQTGTSYYKVKVLHSSETEFCSAPESMKLDFRDKVIIPTRYGKDIACVLGPVQNQNDLKDAEITVIIRHATSDDVKLDTENRQKEAEAFKLCKEKITKHGLEMKLVSAHYVTEESKVLFFFTAESRVDFRELVKDLVSVFKMRIELRQIGVRDESRVLGGLGVCGRDYCCHGITDKLQPVSIKMAKEQNLSLNSMKISGPCGRLLCCLSYEYDFYCSERRQLPSEGMKIRMDDIVYKVIEINVLTRSVKLLSSEGGVMEVSASQFTYNQNSGTWNLSLSINP